MLESKKAHIKAKIDELHHPIGQLKIRTDFFKSQASVVRAFHVVFAVFDCIVWTVASVSLNHK
jgi:hypothetical protein